MAFVLAIVMTIALGLALPVCCMSLTIWLFGDGWNWRHTIFSLPIVLFCINAPAYSAAMNGLQTWKSAVGMHVIAIACFAVATLINGGNPAEGYLLAFLILALSVSAHVVMRAWRAEDQGSRAVTAYDPILTANNQAMQRSTACTSFGSGELAVRAR